MGTLTLRAQAGRVVVVISSILLTFCASSVASDSPPRVGEPIPQKASSEFSVHKGGLLCAGHVLVHGIDFNFDVACGKNKILTFKPST